MIWSSWSRSLQAKNDALSLELGAERATAALLRQENARLTTRVADLEAQVADLSRGRIQDLQNFTDRGFMLAGQQPLFREPLPPPPPGSDRPTRMSLVGARRRQADMMHDLAQRYEIAEVGEQMMRHNLGLEDDDGGGPEQGVAADFARQSRNGSDD